MAKKQKNPGGRKSLGADSPSGVTPKRYFRMPDSEWDQFLKATNGRKAAEVIRELLNRWSARRMK